VDIQPQLVPFVLDLEEGQSSALMELSENLKQLGVKLESLGPHSLAINSYPPIIKERALQEGLLFLAKQRLETGDSFAFERVISDLCATLACHSAIRAGKSLNLEQMQAILKQMDEFPLSSFCPHGRPVFVEYPISRLEKDFGRIS
ncbi:MAG: DNA mismatch repair protein MutL, partial [Oligoflexia bacterium]|nr:DNA mismatch repair protein MutL [Oligoflexia bacterium]